MPRPTLHDIWTDPSPLDHASSRRADNSVRHLWSSGAARVVVIDDDDHIAVPLGAPAEGDVADAFLGVMGEVPWFARRVEKVGGDSTTLRAEELDDDDRIRAVAALATLHWQRDTTHCPRCGGRLLRALHGFQATCGACGTTVFPRTDPAVITAIVDGDDRLLLAHQRTWPTGRVSVLAGFVEAGESAEQAVVREVGEESRVSVSALRMIGTQPWPFPRSLMIGFVARGHGDVVVDADELGWGRWFTRAELRSALKAGEVLLPQSISIARRMINAWLDGSLPSPEG